MIKANSGLHHTSMSIPPTLASYAVLTSPSRFAAVFAACVLACAIGAQEPREASAQIRFLASPPEAVGLSSERLGALVTKMRAWVNAGEMVGGELLIVKNRHVVLHEAVGFRDKEDGIHWQRGTICRLRSMTKPFVGTAVHMLIEQGSLRLEDKVAKYLPSFDNPR